MGFIYYNYENAQSPKATITDENHKLIAHASLSFNGCYWELNPENCVFRDRILRALDSHNIYF